MVCIQQWPYPIIDFQSIFTHDFGTAGNHVTQQQQQWPIFEKNPWLQVRKSSIIPLIHDWLEFDLKQGRWKDSRDLLDVLDFLNNTWSKSYWRANKFFTLDTCLLVNNFFIRCCLTLSQTTNFRLFQSWRVCRRQFQICWKWQKALKMGRKHCGKRRNCSLRAISPFPTVFSKDLYCKHVKTRACLGKG